LEEGTAAVRIARATLERMIAKKEVGAPEVPSSFGAKSGLFVTLATYPGKDLRGCIGYSEPVMAIKDALVELAMAAASRDPRFPRVRADELGRLVIDVTLLTPPEVIPYEDPDQLQGSIVIGRDGLIAEKGPFSGLLLPQVPVEYGWDSARFLSHTCMKAGLPSDEWRRGTVRFKRFSGQVFGETAPGGEVEQVPLV